MTTKYTVKQGPEAYLAPAAAMMGVLPPSEERVADGIIGGEITARDKVVETIAQKLSSAKCPAVCPGPLLLWDHADGVNEKANALRELAEACGAKILPMIDYSAKRIRVDMEISPNHPNVTLEHNGIDVCLFAGVHSHYVNFALRLIRGRTDCYTIVLGDHVASEDAMLSVGAVDVDTIRAITSKIKK